VNSQQQKKGEAVIPKIGQILRRVTPTRELPNITIAKAVEEAVVMFVVVQGGCWRVKLGNGEVFSSHESVEDSGLSRSIPLPRTVSGCLDASDCLLPYRKLDSWPPDGWDLVE
jgi:hypothetical protein